MNLTRTGDQFNPDLKLITCAALIDSNDTQTHI